MSTLPNNHWIDQMRDVASSPLAIIIVCGLMAYVAYTKTRRRYVTYDDEDYKDVGHTKQPAPLMGLQLTRKQLAEYNSNRADKTYLLALHDVIYDVSSGAHDFGPGSKYGMLPGTEITDYIKKQSQLNEGGTEMTLNGWQMMLDDVFYPAGKLIDYADAEPKGTKEGQQEQDQDLNEGDVELGIEKENPSTSSGEYASSNDDDSQGGDDRDEVDIEDGDVEEDQNNSEIVVVKTLIAAP